MIGAYFEMIGGASGNMLLGALCDAGADLHEVEQALRTIPVGGWNIAHERVTKRGIAATHIDFVIPGEDHAPSEHSPADHHSGYGEVERRQGGHAEPHRERMVRHLSEVLEILDASSLSEAQKIRARSVYTRLAEAEAHVHGTSVDAIHFHEVGQVDAILDVAASCVALDLLAIERVFCSAFPIGRGPIAMQHGVYPNPPPATLELLRGAPTYDADIDGEMVTTTGAAILATLVDAPGRRPPMRAERIGYGAGRSDFAIPNVLRVTVGPLDPAFEPVEELQVGVLEANIDDLSPQYYELGIERIFAAGALDVWLTPIVMKKSRPAITLSVLAPLDREAACAKAMLAQTSTLGVRVRHERRYLLNRTVTQVATDWGPVRLKTASVDGQLRRTLEYEDVLRIARERELPIAEVAAQLEKMILRP